MKTRNLLLSICLLSMCNVSFGGWCLTAIPQSLEASALSLGTAKKFGVWEIAITRIPDISNPNSLPVQVVTREELVEQLPFSALQEFQARDVLDRKADTNPWAIWGRVATEGLKVAPTGVGIGALVTNDPKVEAAAIALMAIQFFIGRAQKRAPDPAPTEMRLFPDSGAILTAHGWSGLIVSGIVHSASKFGPACKSGGTTLAQVGLEKLEQLNESNDNSPMLQAYHLSLIMKARSANGYQLPEGY